MYVSFYKNTQYAFNNITSIFNLIHPIRLGMARLIDDVKIVFTDNPEATDTYVNNRVNAKHNIRGMNYTSLIKNLNITEFDNNLSWFLLIHLFTIYENWLMGIKDEGSYSNLDISQMQFPTGIIPNRGYSFQMRSINANSSSFMDTHFFPEYKKV